jgi:plastocyanin
MKKSVLFILHKIVLPLFGAALLICGCEKDNSQLYKPNTHEVWIQHDSYYPCSITVDSGTVVTWTNKDKYVHTVTSNIDGLFDSGQISNGRSFRFKFNTKGTFSYYCKERMGLSCGMIGIVEVK